MTETILELCWRVQKRNMVHGDVCSFFHIVNAFSKPQDDSISAVKNAEFNKIQINTGERGI